MKYFAMRLCLLLVAIRTGSAHYSSMSNSLHDVFHFLHGHFYDSANAVIPADTLQHLYEGLLVKAECAEKTLNCSTVSPKLKYYKQII